MPTLAEATLRWFDATATAVAAVLLAGNLLVIVAVHGRRLRDALGLRHRHRFEAELDAILARLDDGRDLAELHRQVEHFDRLERPLAAARLIERLERASPEEHARTLAALRSVGAVDLALHSTASRLPWRRALAIRTLGWTGAAEAVPVLLGRLDDRSRHVREAAARALGRIGDGRALPALEAEFRAPGRIAAGVAYDALVAFGGEAEPAFVRGLGSELETVRIAAVYGVTTVGAPESFGLAVAPLLADPSAGVRAAAAESLGTAGGGRLPPGLERAAQDDEPAVRSAGVAALGSFDDPHAVDVVLAALDDPDRDTAIRAGESLVRLARRPAAAARAGEALARARDEWPVERASTLESLGVV